ncbi:MAG: asparagine synthase (glutamine-hydrolyzing) [Candidatus Magasanikbacteria bacterium RIFCSPLOWO2_01_FULL_43_20b]|nr:MAG: asparagine synthase (glutamine-hydrolyzing) [Candidatus Magasanikbacteria bacterium RIFCSPHIGHO2_02_FULL_44_13]OGH73265.1 MAG: asparagine synthase (glutamine-hydrolyzing) [Candidatus Magasanikbacteria bacterium RIFCSPLOWO2_01_FULL_43_20b]
MCGINGFNFKNPELITKMNRVISHRGPDDSDIWVGEGFSLGHDRLAIIDLSPRGRQPMWDAEHKIAVVFNGEIYNFKELRAELEKKYRFISQSDTEVIVYAYKEWGIKCFEKFNGIFALAIYNKQQEEIILARDRAGVNPLYYYFNSRQFIFSSEIKAILAHDVQRAVDMEAFNLYFQLLYVPEPRTMFKNIKKLPPAHYLRFRNNQISLERYWQVEDFSNLSSYDDAKKQIKTLFRDAIQKQLISDRPVGVFLSGGMDSSAVLGAVKEFHGGKIKTFSVGFKESTDPNKFNADFELARKTAKHYSTDHHELLVGPEDIKDNLEKIVWHLDEPNSNATAGAVFLLSQLAKQEVAVVLGGDGGDELFGGYPRYYYSALISLARHLVPGMIRKLISLKLNLPANEQRIAAFLCQKPALLAKVINTGVINQQAATSYLKRRFFPNHLCNPLLNQCNQCSDFEKYFMNVDRQSWLVDESLLRTNKMSMAFGLESRVPILDHRLIELSARIPTAWKLSLLQRPSAFQGKRIWRDAIHEYLPNHVLNQQKRGWFTPMAKWLRGGLRDFAIEILSPQNLPAEYFNTSEVQKVFIDHLESREYNLNIVWATVMWTLWYQEFIKHS